MGMETSEILFTRQRHEADRAGLHYDIRLVHGGLAYSWATKLDMPKPGEAIILHQQPVHDATYALSKKIIIPKGQYGAGTTYLDFARKADLKKSEQGDYFTITTKQGEKYLLKHIPKYGPKQWLFKNLTKPIEKQAVMLEMWQHDETGRKTWKTAGETPGEGWSKTTVKMHKRAKSVGRYQLLTKVAKITEKEDKGAKLRPHTQRALKKLERTGGLLVDHSMGSGKTLLYLKAIELHQKKNPEHHALIMAPASLTTNIYKEIKKHKVDIDVNRLETLSYEKAAIDADRLRKKKFAMVVADEAHKLRNTDTKRHKELSDIIMRADKRLLGTGTTAYNHPSDIAPLVNLVARAKVLPEGKAAFEEKYIRKTKEQPPLLKRILGHPPKEIHTLKNKGSLEKILRKHIDHYDLRDDPSAATKFPSKKEVIKEVEMSPEQQGVYKYLEGKLPWHLRMKVRMNLPLDRRDAASLQAFSTGIRQVSNSLNSFMPNYDKPTPKIMAAVNSVHEGHTKDKNFRALVYSNYLGSGLEDYSKELAKRKVPHAIYHGGLHRSQKDELVENYNSGKIKVLLLSSSGAEGLNTKGTKKVQILEPHFNKSKVDQVVARGVRYESHSHLPKAERHVDVEHYISTIPRKRFRLTPSPHSIDQYLHHNSKTKSEVGEQMKNLVKEAHFTTVDHTYERAKYKETHDWEHVRDPVGSIKRDGAAFFMQIDKDGYPHFYSRRPSVRGGFPDRTPNVPHLAALHMPEYAGNAFHVEMIHTGHTYHDNIKDSHPIVSGILNSKKDRAIETQKVIGPVRAVLLDVMNPKLSTYGEKLQYMAKLRESVGNPDFLHMPSTKIGRAEIHRLIEDTKKDEHEGVVITSLTAPEDKNIRIKVKHVDTYNLIVVGITQEVDILGNPKESAGALVCADASGKVVANVGIGLSKELRKHIWENKDLYIGKLIQVRAQPTTAHKLRSPVYNGDADGELDLV
jgi:hypothetical protein